MNDLEFALHVSGPIGKLYGEAKRSRLQFPRNTLITLRSLAELCCDMLRRNDTVEWPGDLVDRIRILSRTHRINRETHEQLEQLRRWGNAAAHPKDSLLNDSDQEHLALDALDAARALLETVFQDCNRGASLPPYTIDDDRPDELRDACYRAVVDNSAPDQYAVGMLLHQQLAMKVAQIEAHPDAQLQAYRMQYELQAEQDRMLDMLRYASEASHPAASFQYGLALTEGQRGKEKVMFGANLIATACNYGDVNAMAWYGRAAMYGLFDEPVDFQRARTLLEQAAAADHPQALTLLSLLYRDGLGVAPNAGTAFDLTLRAAEAGYALAQYNVAADLMHGSGVAADEEQAFAWLQRASDAGLPEAQLALANAWLLRRMPGDEDGIERLLRGAARSINAARLELALFCMTLSDYGKWMDAAGLVQATYESALVEQDAALAERCRASAPRIVAQLEAAYKTMPEQMANDFVLTRFMFDDKRQPYPSRSERTRRFMDLANQYSRQKGNNDQNRSKALQELANGIPGTLQGPAPARPLPGKKLIVGKVGRNDICPCGSGKKYKQCCI
jgi:TPR repeat protein